MCRLPNNTYLGMLSEVRDQYADISVAAYIENAERNILVDFTPKVGLSSIVLLIRRPSKHDISFRYFFLGKYRYFFTLLVFSILNSLVNSYLIEFTPDAWLMLGLSYMVLLAFFGLVLYFMKSYGIERIESQ